MIGMQRHKTAWIYSSIVIVLLLSVISLTQADSGYLVYLQGGDSSIPEENIYSETDLNYTRVIHDTVPYGVILGNTTYLIPLDSLISSLNGTMAGTIKVRGPQGGNMWQMSYTNLVYSNETKTLSIDHIAGPSNLPVEYYDEIYNITSKESYYLPSTGKGNITEIYLFGNMTLPEEFPKYLLTP
jgi:hypothetical protein